MSQIKIALIQKCARCGLDHQDMIFDSFTVAIVTTDGTVYAWWAPCPTNREPILVTQYPTVVVPTEKLSRQDATEVGAVPVDPPLPDKT